MKKLIGALKKRQKFWDLAHFAGRFVPLAYFKRLPRVIKFESTNACNLRCPVCPTHFAITRDRGFMDFELFKRVIDEFKTSPKKKKPRATFSMSGEPLLNKNMAKFIEYASQNGHVTYISTNVTQLDRNLSEKLIRSGLSILHLAVEGISKESHEAYRIGSDFYQVKKNIEEFLKIKRELDSQTPRVVIQTLLTSFSEKEIDDIVDWARGIGADQITFKSLSLGSYTDQELKEEYAYLLPTTNKFLRKKTRLERRLCRRPTRETVIYWNGTLGLCCVDFNDACKLPGIGDTGFMTAWKSKEVLLTRKRGFLKHHGLCKHCSLGNADYGGFSVDLR